MADDKRWEVEADAATSLEANPDDAVLVLRLGMALSAISATHRLTLCVQGDGPGEFRDRLWAFMMTAAYLHEARVTLQPRFPRVRELAALGKAPDDLANEVGDMMSGKSAAGKMLQEIRNEVVFHFDEKRVREWVGQYSRKTVLWAEGIGATTKHTAYQASLDIVAASLIPDGGVADDAGRQRLSARTDEVLRITDKITRFFEHAIAGYMNSIGAVAVEQMIRRG